MDMSRVLPIDCISKIISFTTPKDACSSSLVAKPFKEAAYSDATWETFLPSDCRQIVARSVSPILNLLSPKQLFLHLSHYPLRLANDNKSFWLDKASGKKGYTVGARDLVIIWGDTPRHWEYIPAPESRFPQVAKLREVWWLDVKGRLGTKILSPRTAYVVFFIFKFGTITEGFTDVHVNLSVKLEGSINEYHRRVILGRPRDGVRQREDGWMEVEMGDFFNENGDDVVEYKLWETDGYFKRGLVIEGVEFRPKSHE